MIGIMSRRTAAALLTITLLVALVAVALPVYFIRPFRAESPAEIQISWWLRALSPWITAAGLAAGAALGAFLWRGGSWLGRGAVALSLVPLAAATWFSHQNHFEWMFAPMKRPSFATATDAGFLGPSDMVLAVSLSGEAAAYPVRILAYHHLVQDSVGGVPIVVTY